MGCGASMPSLPHALIKPSMKPNDKPGAAGKLFYQLDTNGDGVLSMAEAKEGASLILGPRSRSLMAKFHEFDENDDGEFNLDEFRKLYHWAQGVRRARTLALLSPPPARSCYDPTAMRDPVSLHRPHAHTHARAR